MSCANKTSSAGRFGYKQKNPVSNDTDAGEDEVKMFRWAVEFLAGPGVQYEKAEVVSGWFANLDDAREDALENAQREVNEYPFSRRVILKLVIEDDTGKIIVLTNVKDMVPTR